jgi:predicted Zn-dependent protease
LEFAAKQEPENPGVLDRLGEIYLALRRTRDALPVLKKAAGLAPRDSTILLRYARALSKAGQKEEASAVFARFRELGPARMTLAHGAGLVDFLSLSPEEQRARYRAGVERTVQRDPSNAEAEVRYLELLLDDGKTEEAEMAAGRIAELKPSLALREETARALIAAQQYKTAQQFIGQFGASDELQLDLAIANAHLADATAGLQEMDRIPVEERNGDYYLALAMILESAGRTADASAAMREALERRPARADLYRELAALLINDHRAPEALRLLDQASRAFPDDAELAMMRDSLRTSASN